MYAAREAIGDADFFLVARTDARGVSARHGLEDAITRANLYAEVGADATFVEAPVSKQELQVRGHSGILPCYLLLLIACCNNTASLPPANLGVFMLNDEMQSQHMQDARVPCNSVISLHALFALYLRCKHWLLV